MTFYSQQQLFINIIIIVHLSQQSELSNEDIRLFTFDSKHIRGVLDRVHVTLDIESSYRYSVLMMKVLLELLGMSKHKLEV